MKALVTYSPALFKEETISVTFNAIGESQDLPTTNGKRAVITFTRIIEEPTSTRTGSAAYRIEYEGTRTTSGTATLAKLAAGGRPSHEGSRHSYTIADDAHEWIMQHGAGQYLTDLIRVIMATSGNK